MAIGARVGLTGGIGSGKSTVAAMLAGRGAFVVDADSIARSVVAPGSIGLERLAETFGAGILLPDGTLDRVGLAAVAFADADSKARLDAITHPLIRQQTAREFATAPAGAVLVHDVALLVELDLASEYDLVVVVDCPDEIRIERLVRRGLVGDDARRRIATQSSREQRLAVADVVIDNSDGREALEPQMAALWERVAPK